MKLVPYRELLLPGSLSVPARVAKEVDRSLAAYELEYELALEDVGSKTFRRWLVLRWPELRGRFQRTEFQLEESYSIINGI
jgi:hypothetical protein